MYKKRDYVYASEGKYLKSINNNSVGFSLRGELTDFIEVEFLNPLNIRIENNMVFIENGLLLFKIPRFDRDSIKGSIVKAIYSLEDLIAIILNHLEGEDELEYKYMMGWRRTAGKMTDEILKFYEVEQEERRIEQLKILEDLDKKASEEAEKDKEIEIEEAEIINDEDWENGNI